MFVCVVALSPRSSRNLVYPLWDVLYVRFLPLENNIAAAWKRNLSKPTAFLEIYNKILSKN